MPGFAKTRRRSLLVVRFFESVMKARRNVHDVNFLDGPALDPCMITVRGYVSLKYLRWEQNPLLKNKFRTG